MGATGALIAAGGGALGQLGTSYAQSRAITSRAKIEDMNAQRNAQLDEMRAADAIKRGQAEEADRRRRTKILMGAQRAAGAGMGVDVGFGSMRDVGNEAATMSEIDAQTIRTNALREAMGYKMSASEARYRGKMGKLAAKSDSRQTLIAGGMSALSTMGRGMYEYGQQK